MLFTLPVVAILAASAAGPRADPFTGKWVLDVEKSRYPRGARPKGMVIEMESVAGGVHYSSATVLANGSRARSEYTAGYDRKPATVVGAHGLLLPVSLNRIAPDTVVASYARGGRVVATSRRVVSSGGNIMTITTTSRDPSGRTVTNVGVYERAAANARH